MLDHLPYSPDLASCDFWLFLKLKLTIKGTRYDSIQDIQKASIDILKAIPAEDFKDFKKFYDRFQRCIDSKGVYFE
jgi:hypothetical protein